MLCIDCSTVQEVTDNFLLIFLQVISSVTGHNQLDFEPTWI